MIKLDLPVIFISVLLPLLGSVTFPFLHKKIKNRYLTGLAFILLSLPPALAGYLTYNYGLDPGILDTPFFSLEGAGSFSMYLDWLSGLYVLGIGVVTPMVAIYSKNYMENRLEVMRSEGESPPSLGVYYMFYIMFSVSMHGVVLSTNLLQFYLFLKITVVASFFLILLYGYGDRKRIALMYLIWSSIAGFVFLLGSLGLASHTGTFDVLDLEELEVMVGIGQGLPLIIPFALFAGLLIKKALFGAHIWLPYAHAEAPTPVSALLSPNLIGISGWGMVRLVYELFPEQFAVMAPYFLILSYFTMMYGGVMALAQDNLKRLMAYISVSQMGWVVFGFTTLTTEGIVGGVLLFVKHSLSLSILFMSAGLLISRHGLKNISDMGDLRKKMPLTSVLMIAGFVILLGLPVSMGFWSKAMIFSGATTMPGIDGTAGFLFMAALLLLAGSITAAYAFITIKRIIFSGEFKSKTGRTELTAVGFNSSTVPMAIIGTIGVLLFLVPDPLLGPAYMPSFSHLAGEAIAFIIVYIISYYLYQGRPEEISRGLYKSFETEIIDETFHGRLVRLVSGAGNRLQTLHTGVMSTYMVWMLAGFLFLLLVFSFV